MRWREVETFVDRQAHLDTRRGGLGPYTESSGRPGVIGHWTNNIVYKRLAPGVWEELKRLTPRTPGGDYKNKLFQRLTEDVGHPKLREHLAATCFPSRTTTSRQRARPPTEAALGGQ
ncbi:hypothetical protein FXB40_08865 [Bradyrhizobium rifense]|uniref:Bacteriophage Mx8 p63 C-terminal domain-containing protein n=1 Tax=Bradyrhizobium rifense TaxID=515499 RepID=A0A5D3KJX2_9BRAD|nr:hypothetical protein FXB40_08865 [Bradyrhizobium rifense]